MRRVLSILVRRAVYTALSLAVALPLLFAFVQLNFSPHMFKLPPKHRRDANQKRQETELVIGSSADPQAARASSKMRTTSRQLLARNFAGRFTLCGAVNKMPVPRKCSKWRGRSSTRKSALRMLLSPQKM